MNPHFNTPSIIMDKSRIIAYTVAVVSEFALAHNTLSAGSHHAVWGGGVVIT